MTTRKLDKAKKLSHLTISPMPGSYVKYTSHNLLSACSCPRWNFSQNFLHAAHYKLIYPLPKSDFARIKIWGDTGVTKLLFEHCRDSSENGYVQYTSHKPFEKYTSQRQTLFSKAHNQRVFNPNLRFLLQIAPPANLSPHGSPSNLLSSTISGPRSTCCYGARPFSALGPAFRNLFLAVDKELLVILSDAGKMESVPGTLSGDETFPGDKLPAPVYKLTGSSIRAPALRLFSCGPKSALLSFPL